MQTLAGPTDLAKQLDVHAQTFTQSFIAQILDVQLAICQKLMSYVTEALLSTGQLSVTLMQLILETVQFVRL